MGPGPHKAEDILKVMEALGAAVIKDRVKDKLGPFGFYKESKTDGWRSTRLELHVLWRGVPLLSLGDRNVLHQT